MPRIAAVDWSSVFVPTVSLLELVLRGSLMYLFVFVAMRLFRRQSGALSTADLLVVVMVADAAQNAMASEYHSLTEGGVLVATIFAWNYGLGGTCGTRCSPGTTWPNCCASRGSRTSAR